MSEKLKKILLSDPEKLKRIVLDCYSLAQVSAIYGFSNHGRNTAKVRECLELLSISYEHFTNGGRLRIEETRTCPQCGNSFTSIITDVKSNSKVTCGHKCANTFFAYKQGTKNRKNGSSTYRKDLIFFYLEKGWKFKCCSCDQDDPVVVDVHHIDEDRSNNSLDNLVPLCVKCHRLFHLEDNKSIFDSIVFELDRRQ